MCHEPGEEMKTFQVAQYTGQKSLEDLQDGFVSIQTNTAHQAAEELVRCRLEKPYEPINILAIVEEEGWYTCWEVSTDMEPTFFECPPSISSEPYPIRAGILDSLKEGMVILPPISDDSCSPAKLVPATPKLVYELLRLMDLDHRNWNLLHDEICREGPEKLSNLGKEIKQAQYRRWRNLVVPSIHYCELTWGDIKRRSGIGDRDE